MFGSTDYENQQFYSILLFKTDQTQFTRGPDVNSPSQWIWLVTLDHSPFYIWTISVQLSVLLTWFCVMASCTAWAVASTGPGFRTSLSSQLSRPLSPSWTLTDWATAVWSCSARSDTDAEREPNLFSKPSTREAKQKTFFYLRMQFYLKTNKWVLVLSKEICNETKYPIREQQFV